MNLQLKYVFDADGTKRLTIPDKQRAMVIDYVRTNALRPPSGVEALVQEGHDELLAAIRDLSDVQAAFKPSPEDWSVLEVLAHVVTVKRVVPALAVSLSEGHWPPGFTDAFQESSTQDGVSAAKFATLDEARAAAADAHASLLAFIRTLDQPSHSDMTFRHFVFGEFNCHEWPVFQRIHDGDHTPHIRGIMASPAFPAR